MRGAIGPYELKSLIGRGGMGEVWEALETRTNRRVALKILTDEALRNDELRARFLLEMEVAAEIENPYVVPVFDFGIGPPPYIAMPLIRGGNLASEITAGRMTAERAVSIVEQVASALAAAHRKGLRHRDVKPIRTVVGVVSAGLLLTVGVVAVRNAFPTSGGRTPGTLPCG